MQTNRRRCHVSCVSVDSPKLNQDGSLWQILVLHVSDSVRQSLPVLWFYRANKMTQHWSLSVSLSYTYSHPSCDVGAHRLMKGFRIKEVSSSIQSTLSNWIDIRSMSLHYLWLSHAESSPDCTLCLVPILQYIHLQKRYYFYRLSICQMEITASNIIIQFLRQAVLLIHPRYSYLRFCKWM